VGVVVWGSTESPDVWEVALEVVHGVLVVPEVVSGSSSVVDVVLSMSTAFAVVVGSAVAVVLAASVVEVSAAG
jgi:hypothetical protein